MLQTTQQTNSIPHRNLKSTPPPPPLKQILKRHHLKQSDLIRCKPMKCTLLKTACAKRWVVANGKTGIATWQWNGPGDQFYLCEKCETGEQVAVETGIIKNFKPKRKGVKPIIETPPMPEFEVDNSKECRILRCKNHVVRGENYCPKHYWQNEQDKKKHGECSIDGCDRAVHAKGVCRRHYQIEWWGKHGKGNGNKP